MLGFSVKEAPVTHLLLFYWSWKALLFLIAFCSPGRGYDTSSTLLGSEEPLPLFKLVRWDAIYFTKTAQRNYVFEQEWAFGWGFSRLLAFIAHRKVSGL